MDANKKFIKYSEPQMTGDIGIGWGSIDFPHYHDFYEIFLLCQGEATVIIDNQTFNVNSGDYFIFRPYECHQKILRSSVLGSQLNITIQRKTFDSAIDYLGDSIDSSSVFNTTAPFFRHIDAASLNLLKSLFETATKYNNTTIFSAEAKLLIINLLGNSLRNNNTIHTVIPNWFRQLTSIMDSLENCSGGVQRMIEISGKSASYLANSFRKYLGITPSQYINEKRILNATYLLENTTDSIINISIDCGFDNLSYFYKCFKRYHGVSPQQYRSNHTNDLYSDKEE